MQEKESSKPIINLPGIRNEMVKDPGYFAITEGFYFGFVNDFWQGIKKVLHKIGVL